MTTTASTAHVNYFQLARERIETGIKSAISATSSVLDISRLFVLTLLDPSYKASQQTTGTKTPTFTREASTQTTPEEIPRTPSPLSVIESRTPSPPSRSTFDEENKEEPVSHSTEQSPASFIPPPPPAPPLQVVSYPKATPAEAKVVQEQYKAALASIKGCRQVITFLKESRQQRELVMLSQSLEKGEHQIVELEKSVLKHERNLIKYREFLEKIQKGSAEPLKLSGNVELGADQVQVVEKWIKQRERNLGLDGKTLENGKATQVRLLKQKDNLISEKIAFSKELDPMRVDQYRQATVADIPQVLEECEAHLRGLDSQLKAVLEEAKNRKVILNPQTVKKEVPFDLENSRAALQGALQERLKFTNPLDVDSDHE